MMRHWFAIAGLAAFFTHCSSSTPDAPPPPKFPNADAFCTGWANAECSDKVILNCAATGKGQCVSQRQQTCMATVVNPQLQIGYAYDLSKAEACVNAVAAGYVDATLTSAGQAAINQACALVFSGTVAKGSPCSADADCKQADGLKCVVHAAPSAEGGASASGVCQVPVSATAGTSCVAIDAVCVDGFHCGTTSHCEADGQVNEPCSEGAPCATGLMCGATGVCQAKTADGQTCVPANMGAECANGICLEGANPRCASVLTISSYAPFCAAVTTAGDL